MTPLTLSPYTLPPGSLSFTHRPGPLAVLRTSQTLACLGASALALSSVYSAIHLDVDMILLPASDPCSNITF